MSIVKVWIYRLLFVCLFFKILCVFVRRRVFLPRIKLVASNFARWFIGILGRKSHISGNLFPQKLKIGRRIGQRAHSTVNRTGRSLA